MAVTLDPPDIHFLNAANGWLDLGNAAEAELELARIAPQYRGKPVVVEAYWRLYAEQRRWEDALEAARLLVVIAPEDPAGWIDQSYALHELKRTREAWDLLLPFARRFPKVSTIPYNLACYACQMGNHAEAERWLDKAAKLRSREEIKRMAMRDLDLKPLWGNIRMW